MKIRYYSLILIVLNVTISCSQKSKKSSVENTPPNIVLIVSDDHGIDALGAYGNPIIKTPHLDALANNGVKFNNAFCTSASCSASRSVILTGKYGHATGHYGHTHDYHHFSTYDSIKSLPVLLKEAGYKTGRIGKYHLAPEQVYAFDEVIKADPRNTVEMAKNSSDFIKTEAPFFLYFCTDDPHRGYPYKQEDWHQPNPFGNKTEGYEGVLPITYTPEDVLVPNFLPDSKETRAELAQYYQSVSRMDQGIGLLIHNLKKNNKYDNTLIIYISDNGIAFAGAKTTVYEPGLKLPCIVKQPKARQKNITNDALINWADLTPTILDYAGLNPSPLNLHGKSFKSILNQEHAKGWDETYAAHNFHELTMYYPMRVIRQRKYKLIWNISWEQSYPFASDLWDSSTWQEVHINQKEFYGKRSVTDYLHRPQYELYDLETDPDEIENLAYMKEYQSIFLELKDKLRTFQLKTSDPWIIMDGHNAQFQSSATGL